MGAVAVLCNKWENGDKGKRKVKQQRCLHSFEKEQMIIALKRDWIPCLKASLEDQGLRHEREVDAQKLEGLERKRAGRLGRPDKPISQARGARARRARHSFEVQNV